MGWWRSGSGQDIIGDGVADRVLAALQELSRKAAASGRPKPSFETVLSFAGAATGERPESLVSDPEKVPPFPKARALMRDGKAIEAAATVPGGEGVAVFRRAFDDVVTDYLVSELKRRPTLSELLATLAFALRVEGTQFMSEVPEELDIDRIVLVQA
jgi:hypothetical protein